MKAGFLTLLLIAAASLAALAKVNIFGHWWENPLPHQETPPGLVSLRAKDCGVCHQEIYREWRESAHAHALSDLQFQEEMKKSPETEWLCLNCHTPLENQLARITTAVRSQSVRQPITRANPHFDAALHEEAVTCAVCHVRDGMILGPYGDSNAPHPVRKESRLLTADQCTQCHQATASYTDTLLCTFDTGSEWSAGPYAKQGRSCSSCHMPQVERAVAAGGAVRASRRHFFFGSKIPKTGNLTAAERQNYALYRPGLTVQVLSARRAGGQAVVSLKLKNARAGHLLPTGDPERFIRVEVRLRAGGKVIASHSLRIGQEWEWWPQGRKLGDNRLKPLEERTETVTLAAAQAGIIEVVVFNARLTEKNARFHNLVGRYPLEVQVLKLAPVPI